MTLSRAEKLDKIFGTPLFAVLLAIGCNRNRLAGRTVDHAERCNALNCARNAGIDIGTDKAAGLAHHSAHIDVITLFHRGDTGGANVLLHG